MTPPVTPFVREADDAVAPFVFIYIVGILVAIGAVLTWVYWCRGDA